MPSLIEWLQGGETWNVIRAERIEDGKLGWFCIKVSDECKECYAEDQNVTCGTNPGRMGNGIRYALDQLPKVRVYLDEPTLLKPLHWRKGRLVFPCSMTDLYAREFVKDEWLDRVHAIYALCPQHTFIELTKRPDRRLEYLTAPQCQIRIQHQVDLIRRQRGAQYASAPIRWPLPNVWRMASCGTQKTANEFIPFLLQTPAIVHGVSAEPLLGPLRLTEIPNPLYGGCKGNALAFASPMGKSYSWQSRVDWVICGGESGHDARPVHSKCVRDLRDQCANAGVPFFFKQWGTWVNPAQNPCLLHSNRNLEHRYVEDQGHNPKCPNASEYIVKAGKHDAGRKLDGKEWNQYPEVAR
ncbi:MAG TPA: DUF5131 family protein [Candidatus Angelobacter sp.]|nr:DUF5131 family protein [Candidatus Angelobacter sp.]